MYLLISMDRRIKAEDAEGDTVLNTLLSKIHHGSFLTLRFFNYLPCCFDQAVLIVSLSAPGGSGASVGASPSSAHIPLTSASQCRIYHGSRCAVYPSASGDISYTTRQRMNQYWANRSSRSSSSKQRLRRSAYSISSMSLLPTRFQFQARPSSITRSGLKAGPLL
jgi:hypothetical protein